MHIILTDYGGVENPAQSGLFLKNMFSDKRILPLPFFLRKPLANFISLKRKSDLNQNYKKINYSPLKKTVKKLVENLNSVEKNLSFCVGFLYLPPYLSEIIGLLKEGVVFPLFPHFSTTTWGSVVDRVKKYKKIKLVKPYYNHPQFLSLIEKKLKKAVEKAGKEKTAIMFTAHSIPKYLEKKEPYVEQVKFQVNYFAEKFDIPVFLAFQSKLGPVKWVSPFIEETVEKIAKEGFENLIVFPLSFTIDNSETLFELDIYLKEIAEKEGIKSFLRPPLFNCDEDFRDFVLNYVKESIAEEKWLRLR